MSGTDTTRRVVGRCVISFKFKQLELSVFLEFHSA